MPPADAFDVSPEAVTRDLIDQVAGRVLGCCGATSETWQDGRLSGRISSHPDLAELMAVEPFLPDSPMRAAVRTMRPVRLEDTLTDKHWRPFSARALDVGVRSLVCVAQPLDGERAMSCTLYGLRPRGLTEQATSQATGLLVEWTTAVAQASAFADVQAEARHLGEAIAARELVEQAKGMLMNALGCDADSAYRELAAAAERAGLKITDVARRMVERRSATLGQDYRPRAHRGARQRNQSAG